MWGWCGQQRAGARGAGHIAVCAAFCWVSVCTVCHKDLWIKRHGGGEDAEPRSVFIQVTDLLLMLVELCPQQGVQHQFIPVCLCGVLLK